ncbi:YceI family protein [Methylovulum psychrotolerans]|uniref:Lipid/polyisoprenoid-binding YceI-like domain-containing protein n=1 Tax=Methylovulum psychrotolerans TaxID=1704499 RepID=A0A2S5CL49_9GAMM|nr:YceI family protein [Methylovulum psychrotolerans]POZ51540.1 hypothetical protein AADEFJLK_02406 [Methylovulum psychrotolerans]
MQIKTPLMAWRHITAAFILNGCSTLATTTPSDSAAAQHSQAPDMQARYAQWGQAGGKVFALDPHASQVLIYAFRAGRAAKLGHNHVLSAPVFTGFFNWPTSGAPASRFDLEFRLDQLVLDNPKHRAGLGGNFAAVLSPEAIAATREHMLGADNMQATAFPFVRIHSLQIAGEAPKFAAKIAVELHGQTREMWLPLNVDGLPERLSVTGALVLRQSDFGAQPYSVLGGMLAVQDELVVEFTLQGVPVRP